VAGLPRLARWTAVGYRPLLRSLRANGANHLGDAPEAQWHGPPIGNLMRRPPDNACRPASLHRHRQIPASARMPWDQTRPPRLSRTCRIPLAGTWKGGPPKDSNSNWDWRDQFFRLVFKSARSNLRHAWALAVLRQPPPRSFHRQRGQGPRFQALTVSPCVRVGPALNLPDEPGFSARIRPPSSRDFLESPDCAQSYLNPHCRRDFDVCVFYSAVQSCPPPTGLRRTVIDSLLPERAPMFLAPERRRGWKY